MCVYVCFCFREERFLGLKRSYKRMILELKKGCKKAKCLCCGEREVLENEEAKQKPTQT